MELQKKIIAFAQLGKIFKTARNDNSSSPLYVAIEEAIKHNLWFTYENIYLALESLGNMLKEDNLRTWAHSYKALSEKKNRARKIGVIMAGNIPLVGFHDFLCVLMSGNNIQAKLSSTDSKLLPTVAKILIDIEPLFKERIAFVNNLNLSAERAKEQDALSAFIATGSNNSAKHFEYYLAKYPHLIRKNRSAIAIITGKETGEELKNLTFDIFQYFGMGCRNVSKVYIPSTYNLDTIFTALVDAADVIHHNKYANNYNYYRCIYLLNSELFLDNNFILVKESKTLASPIATLYYEKYKQATDLYNNLDNVKEEIQCIACNSPLPSSLEPIRVPLGSTQQPTLWDYADGVDTMQFLLDLSKSGN